VLQRSTWILLVAALSLSPPLWAHGVNLFVAVEGDLIHGRVFFGDGYVTESSVIRISDRDGNHLAEIVPQEDGSFTYQTRQQIDHLITADGRDGHVIKRWVKADMLSGDAFAPAGESPGGDHQLDEKGASSLHLEKVVARQITPLREELAAYQAQLRLRDILGGLGYILGLAGLALWLKCHDHKVEK
jgi:nickel transport protein